MRGQGQIASLLTAGALILSPAPALAQHHDHHGDHHYRDHDHVDAGDVALGAVLGGGLIALLAGRHGDVDDGYASAPPDYGYDYDGAAPVDYRPPDYAGSRAETPEARSQEAAAVDACAASAEAQGAHYARVAHVESVATVNPAGAQAWLITGTISLKDDYRHTDANMHDFRCSISTGGVQDLHIDGLEDDS